MLKRINDRIEASLKARKDGDQGFSMVELLIYIVIVIILIGIAIPAFLQYRKSAALTGVQDELRSAQTALENGYTLDRTYSTTEEGLAGDGFTFSGVNCTGTPVACADGSSGVVATVTPVAATATSGASYRVTAYDLDHSSDVYCISGVTKKPVKASTC